MSVKPKKKQSTTEGEEVEKEDKAKSSTSDDWHEDDTVFGEEATVEGLSVGLLVSSLLFSLLPMYSRFGCASAVAFDLLKGVRASRTVIYINDWAASLGNFVCRT
jgi:hypothetical protein